MNIPLPPGITLFPFQQEGVEFLCSRKSAFLADEMGLGKTVQVIAYTNVIKPEKVLIICPSSLKINWLNEFNKFSTNNYNSKVIFKGTDKIDDDDTLIISSYDIVVRNIERFKSISFDLIVIDESHYIKDSKTKRCRSIQMLNAEFKIALTGTPILNRPVEIFETLKWLDSSIFPSFYNFARRYCFSIKQFSHYIYYEWNGANNLEELQQILADTVLLRRRKLDVLTQLPSKTRQLIKIEGLTSARKEQHAELFEKIAKITGEQDKKKKNVGEFIKALAIERHKLAVEKVKYTTKYVEDLLCNTGKVVVFAHHLDVIDLLHEYFQKNEIACVKFTGRMKPEEKQQSIDKFQNDNCIRVILATIRTASVGVTLTAASTVIFHELDYAPGLMLQAEDRVHRIGQRENVLIQHIVFDGGIDSMMAKILLRKQAIFNRMFGEKTSILEISEEDKGRYESAINEPTDDFDYEEWTQHEHETNESNLEEPADLKRSSDSKDDNTKKSLHHAISSTQHKELIINVLEELENGFLKNFDFVKND